MNSAKLLLSQLPYEPTTGNKSICGICKKPVSNLLLLAHSLIHKDETILSKSIESSHSTSISPSIILQQSQPNQTISTISPNSTNESKPVPDQEEKTSQKDLNNNLTKIPINPPEPIESNPEIIVNQLNTKEKKTETKLSVTKCIKNSNACHTKFRRIEFTFKRCLRLQVMKGFRKMKKTRFGR